MTTQMSPRPMVDDPGTSDEMKALLAFARSDGPSAAQLERLSQRIAPVVGVSVAVLGASTLAAGIAPAEPAAPVLAGAGSAAVKSGFGKLLGSSFAKLIAASCAVGASLWWWSATPSAAPRPAEIPRAPIIAPAAPEQLAPQRVPVAEPAVVTEAAPAEAPVTPKAQPKKRVAAPGAPAPSELSLIQEAQALREKPRQALRVLETHARLYPSGMLAQEREVLAIEALLASGRRGEAEARSERLAARYPGSAHLRRVKVLLGESAPE